MRVRRKLTLLATVTSLAVTGIAAGGVANAAAATATLSIPYTGCQSSDGRYWDYTAKVQGTTGYYPDGMRVEVRLWGEDEWYDDFLGGPYIHTYSFSGSYEVSFCVNRSRLNEDIGRDEIYAGVRVFDRATGSLREKTESNRLYNYW